MEVLTGLTAASQAIGIIKQLRDLDKALDEAIFKSKLLELQEAVFDAKSALLDAKQNILEKDERIAELEGSLKSAESGDKCPVCRNGTLQVKAVRPHPSMGDAGIQERDLQCSNAECQHSERRVFDPMGILKR